MSEPDDLDIDTGSDSSYIETDSWSVSNKRFSESALRSGMVRHYEPDSGAYGGAQALPTGAASVYDPSGQVHGACNVAAFPTGSEFGARPTPMVHSQLEAQNAGLMTETGGPRPLYQYHATVEPEIDQTGRTLVDPARRPVVGDDGRRVPEQGGTSIVDSAERRQPGGLRHLLGSTGRLVLDFAGNPVMDYSGGQLPAESAARPTAADHPSLPTSGAYPDSDRQAPMLYQTDRAAPYPTTERPMVDQDVTDNMRRLFAFLSKLFSIIYLFSLLSKTSSKIIATISLFHCRVNWLWFVMITQ